MPLGALQLAPVRRARTLEGARELQSLISPSNIFIALALDKE